MKKHSTVVLALILCLSMLFHTSAVAIDTLVPDIVYWEDKIDESVYESPIYENGKRLIYIQRESIPQETISNKLKQTYNYSMEVYEDELAYKEQILPVITAKVIAERGETAAYSTAEQLRLTGEAMTPIDLAVSEDYDNYIMAKRSTYEALYTVSNSNFLKNKIENTKDVLYQGMYTSDFILYATDTEIKKYAKHPDVTAIVPFENKEHISETSPIEQTQIGADSISGTKSSLFNSGSGYKGTGVKIGIIEMGRYDPTAYQLQSIHGTQLEYGNSSTYGYDIDNHATMVTSLIVGQPYTLNGCTYEGIVPNATAYLIASPNLSTDFAAIDQLLKLGVTIINFSAGYSATDGSYNESIDGRLDELIQEHGFTFIKSSGNTGSYVTSPGKAFNAIVVGNAVTKNYDQSATSSPFEIDEDSSYVENTLIGNRPDLVAPGNNLAMAISGETPWIDSGTSFSAPLVSGVVAQLHQARPFLKTNPTATKAIILAGADPDVISTIGNAITECQYLRDKSGAGMVNAVNSINLALNYQYVNFNFDLSVEGVQSQEYITAFTVPAGKKARVVMTFNKIDGSDVPSTGYQNNVNFAIHDNTTEEEIASSNLVYSNVEIIEFTSQRRWNYYVNATLLNHTLIETSYPFKVSIAWSFVE